MKGDGVNKLHPPGANSRFKGAGRPEGSEHALPAHYPVLGICGWSGRLLRISAAAGMRSPR